MGRNNRTKPTGRLTEESVARLEELRQRCSVLDQKGRSDTVHHEELARLEALVAGTAETEPLGIPTDFVEEDLSNGQGA